MADGKSLTATNLSYALAERARVLLLELDLRRPSLKRTLGLEEGSGVLDRGRFGIASVLREDALPEAAVRTIASMTRRRVVGRPRLCASGPTIFLCWCGTSYSSSAGA